MPSPLCPKCAFHHWRWESCEEEEEEKVENYADHKIGANFRAIIQCTSINRDDKDICDGRLITEMRRVCKLVARHLWRAAWWEMRLYLHEHGWPVRWRRRPASGSRGGAN